MTGFAVKAVIVLIAIVLVVVLIARFFRRASPATPSTRRQRMPMLIALAGILLLAAGFTLGVAAFASRYTAELLPARVASVVVFLAGIALLLAHRNWYVEVGADAVRFRTVLGREKSIAYRDIASARTVTVAGRPRMIVHSTDGVRLSIDTGRYDMTALIAAARA